MSSRHSEKRTYQYDSKGLKNKVNHHDFLETRDGGEEYTAFDLERFKGDLMEKFIRDTDEIADENDRLRSSASSRVEEYERNNLDTQDINLGEEHIISQRRTIADQINTTNRDFDRTTKEATSEKKRLREDMADLEDALRKVRDQLAETELENQNLTTIVDAVKDIQSSQKNAEENAVRTVNLDLKDQVTKLEHELEFTGGPADTHNIKYGLEEKYKSAKTDFGNFITEAETGKKRVEDELANLRKNVSMKKNENSVLQKDINDNENEIKRLNNEIERLSKDIEQLKKRNEDGIKTLEGDRGKSEGDIVELKKKTADVQHECAKLRILIEKTRNEIDYLNSEKDKSKGQGYQKKIDAFNSTINESEKKAKVLKDELGALNSEWKTKVDRSSKLASSIVRDGEGDATSKRISMLTKELSAKNRELDDLRSKKNTLERELSDDGGALDDKIQRQRDQLDELNRKYLSALEEKNMLFAELSEQAKKLLAYNDAIQKNAEEIAIAKQEIEFLKKEIEQKGKLVGDLEFEVEQRRNLIIELRDEIAEKNRIIDELEQPRDEIETIEILIKEKDEVIRELEAQLRQRGSSTIVKKTVTSSRTSTRTTKQFKSTSGNEVDTLLEDFISSSNCPVPIQKLSDGNYMFGTRKIFAKVLNGNLMIRVGGGYMSIDEFIETYGDAELRKIEDKRARGEDPFDFNNSSGSPGGSPNRSGY
jgi:DNA repair exonuclease SbcCD ATPase subunit